MIKILLFTLLFSNVFLCNGESISCTGHDACKNKIWNGEYDITCGAANSERTCKSTTLNCGANKDCTIKTQGSGHDAYQNSVVNAKESNSFKLTCQASGLRDCQSITIWCPQSSGSTCECISCPSSVTMKCVEGISCDSVSNANIDYVKADEILDGYIPELDNGPDDCCEHTAPWDDPFTLMCQTCAYDVIGKLKTDITYKWYSQNDLKYEITCYTTGEYSVRCNGKNNENGGRPSYSATCGTDCITDYDKIPGKEYVWLKNTQNKGKRPDCPKVGIPGHPTNQNYKWGTLEQCKKSCIMEPTGKCNMLSRYGEGIKELTEQYHCRFYACEEPFNFNWIIQEQWGNEASSCQTYMLPIRHNTLQHCDNIINKTRWTNETRWLNKTNIIDKIKWENKTNIIDKTNWINKTIYKYINFSDYFYDDSILENICNEYRYSYYSGKVNEAWTTKSWKLGCSQYKLGFKTLGECKSQCSCNKSPKSFSSHSQYKICSKTYASTNYISCRQNSCSGGNCCSRSANICKDGCKAFYATKFSGKMITYKDVDKYIYKIKNETRWKNKTNIIDKIRWKNKTNIIDKIRWKNKTRWINKTRWLNKTRWINKTNNEINKVSCKNELKNNQNEIKKGQKKENNTNLKEKIKKEEEENVEEENVEEDLDLVDLSKREIIFIIVIIILLCLTSCGAYISKFFYEKNGELKRRIKNINNIQLNHIPTVRAENIIIGKRH